MIQPYIPSLLRERVGFDPNGTAFTFIDYESDWEGVAESLTWSQLYRRTSNLMAELANHADIGDRAVILAPQGLDYIIAFYGALQAGLIPVPLPVPIGGVNDERASSVLQDTAPTVIFTTSPFVEHIAEYAQAQPGATPAVIAVDALKLDDRVSAADSGRREYASLAYLQYTSGSTRTPAGVMVSHENLLTNFKQISADYFTDYGRAAPPDTTVVSWLPFY